MPDYLLNAADCPALMTPATLLNPANGTPIVAPSFEFGEVETVPPKLNETSARLDVLGRYGGGAYAIVEGLAASTQTGLTLTITAGQAMLDGPVTLAAAEAVALTDNATNYVWFTQAGNLVVVVGATTPPPGVDAAVFLCRVVTDAGVQGTPDYSGRYELRGGTLYRRTGDAGTPADTPPSTVQFLAQTAGGRYWWDGSAYTPLLNDGAVTNTKIGEDISVANGGTGASDAATARTNLGAAAAGANSDITSLSGLTTPLSLAQGGTAAVDAAGARTSLGLGGLAVLNPGAAVADLVQTISNPPTQAEVQAVQDKVNAMLASLRGAGIIAT